MREHFGDKVCRNVVPRTVRLSEAPSFGQPIIAFDPTLAGRHRLPGAGQGGERWRAAAGSVRGSAALIPGGGRRATTGTSRSRSSRSAGIEPNPHQPRAHFDEEALGRR